MCSWQSKILMCGTVAFALAACDSQGPGAPIYTLYRSSTLDQTMRIHVATFDTAERRDYNASNCADIARVLNQRLAAVTDGAPTQTWWCEPGRFRSG
jgi:hypothetical protein